MSPTRLSLLTAAFAAATSSGASGQNPSAAIDRFLARHLASTPTPGFAAVVVKDGEVIFQKGYGVEVVGRSKPLTVRSPIAIGSQTKSLTAVAIMRLVEAGKVELDAPVTRYLPWFRTADQRGGEITVRMLLHNTSGLPSIDRGLRSQDTDEGAIEREVRALSTVALGRAPGKSFEYSNENWTVAGAVITAVTGRPYSAFLEDDVLGPLGMTRSSTALARFEAIGALWGHYPTPEGVRAGGPRFLAGAVPAGSELRVTAEDMGRYLSMLLRKGAVGSGRFLTQESVAALFVPGSVTNISMPDFGLSDSEAGYGMGWFINQADGRTLIHHGGDAIMSGSWTAIDTASHTAASLLDAGPSLDSYRYPTRIWVVNNLLRLATGQPLSDLGRPKETDPTRNDYDLPADRLDRYLGAYLSGDGLKLEIARSPSRQALSLAVAGGPIRYQYEIDFASEASAVLRNIGGSTVVTFLLTPKGQVTGLAGGLPGGTFRKRSADELSRIQELRSPSGAVRVQLPRRWTLEWRGDTFSGLDPLDSTLTVVGGLEIAPPRPAAAATVRTESIGRHQWIRRSWIEGSGTGAVQRMAFSTTVAGRDVVIVASSRAGRQTRLLRDVVVPLLETIDITAPLRLAPERP